MAGMNSFYYGEVGVDDSAPTPAEVEETTMPQAQGASDNNPTMVWVGMVLILVLIRVLQEYSGSKGA